MRIVEGETRVGAAGSATRLLLEGPRDRPEQDATLASWWLRCPGQSPLWDTFLLSVIHLREIEGVRSPVVRVAGATHEVMLLALDPSGDGPSPTDPTTWRYLTPYNLMEQVHLVDDDQAVVLAGVCVDAVLAGSLWAEPPLSGQVEPWRTSLIRTSAHLRGEEHAP